jgi:hypothetical protein
VPEVQERNQAREREERRAAEWERRRVPAREAFVAHLKKRTPKLLAIFRATTDRHFVKDIEQKLGFRVTNDATAAVALVVKSLNEYSPESFAKVADICGFSLSKFTKAQQDAEKKAAAKLVKNAKAA